MGKGGVYIYVVFKGIVPLVYRKTLKRAYQHLLDNKEDYRLFRLKSYSQVTRDFYESYRIDFTNYEGDLFTIKKVYLD